TPLLDIGGLTENPGPRGLHHNFGFDGVEAVAAAGRQHQAGALLGPEQGHFPAETWAYPTDNENFVGKYHLSSLHSDRDRRRIAPGCGSRRGRNPPADSRGRAAPPAGWPPAISPFPPTPAPSAPGPGRRKSLPPPGAAGLRCRRIEYRRTP